MICVSEEYEIKTKMAQEWLQLKMTLLFFYWVELTFGGERHTYYTYTYTYIKGTLPTESYMQ